MSELTLQKLIRELKKDLFLSHETESTTDSPELFIVESAEIEVAISVNIDGEAGLKITVLPTILEGSLGGGISRESTGTVRIKLAPIIAVDELRANRKKNSKAHKKQVETSEVLFQGGDYNNP